MTWQSDLLPFLLAALLEAVSPGASWLTRLRLRDLVKMSFPNQAGSTKYVVDTLLDHFDYTTDFAHMLVSYLAALLSLLVLFTSGSGSLLDVDVILIFGFMAGLVLSLPGISVMDPHWYVTKRVWNLYGIVPIVNILLNLLIAAGLFIKHVAG